MSAGSNQVQVKDAVANVATVFMRGYRRGFISGAWTGFIAGTAVIAAALQIGLMLGGHR